MRITVYGKTMHAEEPRYFRELNDDEQALFMPLMNRFPSPHSKEPICVLGGEISDEMYNVYCSTTHIVKQYLAVVARLNRKYPTDKFIPSEETEELCRENQLIWRIQSCMPGWVGQIWCSKTPFLPQPADFYALCALTDTRNFQQFFFQQKIPYPIFKGNRPDASRGQGWSQEVFGSIAGASYGHISRDLRVVSDAAAMSALCPMITIENSVHCVPTPILTRAKSGQLT